MKNETLNTVKVGDTLTATKNLYNPYYGGLIVEKGELVEVLEVLRKADGTPHRISISPGEHSPYKTFAILSLNHLDMTEAFIRQSVDHHYPDASEDEMRRLVQGEGCKTTKIAEALRNPSKLTSGTAVYFTYNHGKVGITMESGYFKVTLKDHHIFTARAFKEIAQLMEYCADNKSMP